MITMYPADRRSRPRQRKAMEKLANRPPRTDTPTHLPVAAIKQQPGLFQPRFESIAFAPGRSEGHIAHLARVARSGAELDPVAVVPFGNDWYLVDGHHRLEAYRVAEWTGPIPVEPRHSPLIGAERVAWAILESVRENKKNRLAMSDTDRMDAAWAAVAQGDELSIRETALAYGVSSRSVANMRKVASGLAAVGAPVDHMPSWRGAQNELQRLSDDRGGNAVDPDERRRIEAARRLKGAMDLKLPPRLLAEALEAYEPGIVGMMALALSAAREDEDGDDLI